MALLCVWIFAVFSSTVAEYQHQCPDSRSRGDLTNRTLCADMGPRVCQNGYCEATATGDYQCRCNDGYRNSDDMKHCVGNKSIFDYLF